MATQGWLFLSTVVAGAAIGFFYDVFRVFRKIFSHSGWAVQLEDVLFWAVATAAMFYFMLGRSFGEIRLFALAGMVCGSVLYFATVSRYVRACLVTVINFARKVIVAAWRLLTAPLRFVFNLLTPPTKKFLTKRRKNLRTLGNYGKIQMKKSARSWYNFRKKY